MPRAILLMIVLSIAVLGAGPRVRRSCVIGWDANAEPDLAGYRVYTSTTQGSYGSPVVDVGTGVTSRTCRQLGLTVHNQQYYVVVTAYDTSEPPNESLISNELSLVVTMGSAIFR
jgi:hypothetical protein